MNLTSFTQWEKGRAENQAQVSRPQRHVLHLAYVYLVQNTPTPQSHLQDHAHLCHPCLISAYHLALG